MKEDFPENLAAVWPVGEFLVRIFQPILQAKCWCIFKVCFLPSFGFRGCMRECQKPEGIVNSKSPRGNELAGSGKPMRFFSFVI